MKEEGSTTTSHSWLQNVILVGKTTGGFALLIMYLAIPKPYPASQFATLSLARGLPGQSPSEVEKEKQDARLEDARQESTIGTAVESEASGSIPLPEEVRRTSSSAVSIERRESHVPERSTSSWEDPRPFPLEQIKEQEVATNAPLVQEMTTGVASSSTPNLPSLAERNQTRAGKSHLIHRTPLSPLTTSSPRGPALQSNVSDPGNLNLSQSQSSRRRRCSPCSESLLSCCQASFNSLRRRPTLALSSPPPAVPAQRMSPLRGVSTDQVSTQSSLLEWDDRLTDDLVEEYFSKPTDNEKVQFFDECLAKTNEAKMNRFYNSVERQEEYQLQRANSLALARAAEIDLHIHNSNSSLLKDTTPTGGFSETSSRDYRAPNYQENIPWQLRLVPKDGTRIQPTDIDAYPRMRSHEGDITINQVTSQRRQVEQCPTHLRLAQEKGRKRLLEAAIKNGHIRTLPMGRDDNQTVQNIVAI